LRSVAALIAIVLLSGASSSAFARGSAPLEFQPAVIELTGRFELMIRFGPPNYGEDPRTDLKIEVPVLMLSRPVSIRGRPGDPVDEEPVEDIGVVQLVLPPDAKPYELIDKNVVAKGRLTHATRGPEFMPVLMQVNKIEARE